MLRMVGNRAGRSTAMQLAGATTAGKDNKARTPRRRQQQQEQQRRQVSIKCKRAKACTVIATDANEETWRQCVCSAQDQDQNQNEDANTAAPKQARAPCAHACQPQCSRRAKKQRSAQSHIAHTHTQSLVSHRARSLNTQGHGHMCTARTSHACTPGGKGGWGGRERACAGRRAGTATSTTGGGAHELWVRGTRLGSLCPETRHAASADTTLGIGGARRRQRLQRRLTRHTAGCCLLPAGGSKQPQTKEEASQRSASSSQPGVNGVYGG